ncbi:hypothetical protein N9R04_00960 [Staphylococcus sp. SQ8-PEA]|uniref:DUF1129 family protein n=1 Tax=Staphylococcus marylandisciuri TaxID=2981529 RepID=A0ABT2QMU3_9STAP|nr:hypothetical protein [Staphylococcus marylandisciuri]MCU5745290.1 hypothetical protein [Staphylococcus marylandisciuri]
MTQRSEDYLTRLRIELMFRGREEQEITEITDELRDHFATAEANGESNEDILQTPVQKYADQFAKQMHLFKGIYKFLGCILILLISIFTIPKMLDGTFTLNLMLIIELVEFILAFIFIVWLLRITLVHYGESKRSYVIFGISFALTFLSFLAMNYLEKHFPLIVFWHPSATTTIVLGLLSLVIISLFFVLIKQKFQALTLVIVSLPEIIGLILTGDTTSQKYLYISLIITIMIWVALTFGPLLKNYVTKNK